MKKTILCAVGFWIWSLPIYSITLHEAVADKKVALTIRGAAAEEIPTGMAYSPKITFAIENLSASPLQIELEEGYTLLPAEKSYQPQVLAEPMVASLAPKQKSSKAMMTYCMDLSKSSPSVATTFSLGDKAAAGLYDFIKWSNSQKIASHAIQDGVWSFTSGMPIMSIEGTDAAQTENIRRQCASLQKQNYNQLKQQYAHKKNSEILSAYNGKKYDRNIVFRLDSHATVQVAYHRHSGEQIRSITDSTLLLAGTHAIRYSPFPASLSGQRYSVRLLVNGELAREYFYRQ